MYVFFLADFPECEVTFANRVCRQIFGEKCGTRKSVEIAIGDSRVERSIKCDIYISR